MNKINKIIRNAGFLLMFLVMANVALAGSGVPSSTVATYNADTHELSTHGTYSGAPCNDRRVGYALFVDGANPVTPGSGSLDGVNTETMHLVSTSSCDASGNWEDNTHSLDDAPDEVCVVIYDVHFKDGHAKEGEKIPAGGDRNKDNSYEDGKDDSFGPNDCVEPEIVHNPPNPVPEFTTLGALAALGGAGVYLAKRRKNRK